MFIHADGGTSPAAVAHFNRYDLTLEPPLGHRAARPPLALERERILIRAGHLPDGWGFGVAAAVLLSSAYGFASLDAKTDDHYFTGFPSYWNIVALYLHAAGTPPVFNAVLLLVLVALVFVRIGYVYPSRTPVLQRTTVLLGAIWAIMMLVVLYMLPHVPRTLLVISLFFPVYYTMLSFWLHFDRRP